MTTDPLTVSFVALSAFSAASLGLLTGTLYGSSRTRREWQPLINWAMERASRPISLTITQPPHTPGTVHVTETLPAPPIDPDNPPVLDHAEQERRKLEEAQEFQERMAATVGAGGFAPGMPLPPVARRVVRHPDPLVQDLVIEPALAVE